MPELSPKQLTVWLLIAAVILFVGARALRGEQATHIDPGSTVAGFDARHAPNRAPNAGARMDLEGGSEPDRRDAGEAPSVHIHVAGAVRRAGLYRLRPGSRVADALRRAGGANGRADLDQVNLAATLIDGQQVFVPRRGQASSCAMGLAAGDGDSGAAATAGMGAERNAPIVLSTATAAQLETIDGIGPVTAAKILEFRDEEGGIGSIEQLDAVPGIGPATLETLRQALVP